MPLSVNEQYIASAACFVGGTLSVVTHLWLLWDFLPLIKMPKSLRPMHYQLSVANLLVVALFWVGGVSHFEQKWIFGPNMCTFYTFWCKFGPVASVSVLAVCLYAENQVASNPAKKDHSFTLPSLFAWMNGLIWGVLAVQWAQYGQEPAGHTCTVIWYKVQPYVTYMSLIGFGVPLMMSAYYAYKLWSSGSLYDNPLAKSASVLFCTMLLQFSAYSVGYVWVCLGNSLSLYAIAFPQIWTKTLGVLHPFVYSNMFAAEDGGKRD